MTTTHKLTQHKMKCDKGTFCDWCEYRIYEPRENTQDKPVDYCKPPNGKCPVKGGKVQWKRQSGKE